VFIRLSRLSDLNDLTDVFVSSLFFWALLIVFVFTLLVLVGSTIELSYIKILIGLVAVSLVSLIGL